MEIAKLANLNEIPHTDGVKKQKYVSYRGDNKNLERTPDEDSFNTKKAVVTGIGLLAIASAIFGAVCFKKGAAEGVEKDILKQMKDGFNEIIGKLEKEVKSDVKSEAKPEAKIEGEQKAESTKAKEKAEKSAKTNKEKPLALDYELNIQGNKIIVKNGKVSQCVNEHGQEWKIDDKTDSEFRKLIESEVEKRNNEITNKSKKVARYDGDLAEEDVDNIVDFAMLTTMLDGAKDMASGVGEKAKEITHNLEGKVKNVAEGLKERTESVLSHHNNAESAIEAAEHDSKGLFGDEASNLLGESGGSLDDLSSTDGILSDLIDDVFDDML